MRRGSTLIEALIALVLFQIAALALAATSAVAARDLGIATRYGNAESIARDRVARQRPAVCGGASGGSQEHAGGLEEQWWIVADGRTRKITDSVTLRLPRGRKAAVVVTAWEYCP